MSRKFRPVVVESPYRSNDEHSSVEHETYLSHCILDCIRRGESPYASHRMLTHVLNDDDQEERELGIEAGYAWHDLADIVVFYTDMGLTTGMMAAKARCERLGIEWEFRSIHH